MKSSHIAESSTEHVSDLDKGEGGRVANIDHAVMARFRCVSVDRAISGLVSLSFSPCAMPSKMLVTHLVEMESNRDHGYVASIGKGAAGDAPSTSWTAIEEDGLPEGKAAKGAKEED